MADTSNVRAPAARETMSHRVRWARKVYLYVAWVFLAGIAVQVFLAGLGLFVGASWWAEHRRFVHALEALPILMLVLAFVGHLPVAMRWLTAATFALIGVQYATIEMGLPALAAFHPVNAILLFWLTLALARRAAALNEPTRGVVLSAT